MEMSIDNAKTALANPTAELKELLTDERVPQEARDGLKAAGLDVEELKKRDGENASSGKEITSRLQVVDEHQNFSYVWIHRFVFRGMQLMVLTSSMIARA
jgi:hypothetical protein